MFDSNIIWAKLDLWIYLLLEWQTRELDQQKNEGGKWGS